MKEEDQQLQQFVSAMPKVELHAHLNGCIREETLFDLARERKVLLPPKLFHLGHHHQPSAAHNDADHSCSFMYNVKPRSLTDCFDMFHVIPKCVNDLKALERITREALEDFAHHHVVYLELRSTPKRINNSLTKRQYIETILGVMRTFQELEQKRYQESQSSREDGSPRLPMTCRFLVSIDRSGTVEEAEENVALAVEFFQQPNSMVVGVDIGGNPTRNDFHDFQPALAKARQAGLKTTVHCAEVPVGEETDEDPKLRKSYEEVSAIFAFQPDRLGHALLLPASLRDLLVEEIKVPVESCPTSNVMTLELAKHMGGDLIHGLQQHPQLKCWLESDYPISIGTDDPGVFNTNATQELLLLARALGVTQEQLKRIVMNSIDHGFCNDEMKDTMKKQMMEFFTTMLRTTSERN